MMRSEKGMIIGLFFVLFGLSILVKVFFKIDLPVMRVFFACFLLFLGGRMLLGAFGMQPARHWHDQDSAIFSENDFKHTGTDESGRYNVIFGKSTVDLTQAATGQKDVRVEVNAVFGETTVYIDPGQPVKVRANSVFGETELPDENTIVFGTLNYRTESAKTAAHTLRISTNCVFGAIKVRARPAEPAAKGTGAKGTGAKDAGTDAAAKAAADTAAKAKADAERDDD